MAKKKRNWNGRAWRALGWGVMLRICDRGCLICKDLRGHRGSVTKPSKCHRGCTVKPVARGTDKPRARQQRTHPPPERAQPGPLTEMPLAPRSRLFPVWALLLPKLGFVKRQRSLKTKRLKTKSF